MQYFPAALQELADSFARLPGIGGKSAQRLAFHVLGMSDGEAQAFADAIVAAGVTAVWGTAMVNAGATVLDHLPHGSFFHATGGSMGMSVKERLKLIPYESIVGLVLTVCSVVTYLLF